MPWSIVTYYCSYCNVSEENCTANDLKKDLKDLKQTYLPSAVIQRKAPVPIAAGYPVADDIAGVKVHSCDVQDLGANWGGPGHGPGAVHLRNI